VCDIRPISSFFFRFFSKQNKEERYSRVPRLSDTRYSAKGTKGKWRYASSKARLKYATYIAVTVSIRDRNAEADGACIVGISNNRQILLKYIRHGIS